MALLIDVLPMAAFAQHWQSLVFVTGQQAHKAENISYLSHYRDSLSTHDLGFWGASLLP